MTNYFFPLIFVLLWSSAFVSAKIGLEYATPFAFLALRFIVVLFIFLSAYLLALCWRSVFKIENNNFAEVQTKGSLILTAIVGLLLQGFYLGSCFYAIWLGVGAALTGLIVSMQPLLTTVSAIFFLGERPKLLQWIGIFIGFSFLCFFALNVSTQLPLSLYVLLLVLKCVLMCI